MQQPQAEENVEFLLAAARTAGFAPTRSKLRRWQQSGLIPKPKARGLGRGRGTVISYPAGTARQLVRLCELLRRDRSFQAAAWRLWWEGFQIPEPQVREWFGRQLAVLDSFRAELTRSADRPDRDDAMDVTIVDELSDVRLSDPILSRARGRTGRASFPTFMHFALKAAAGIVDRMQDDDAVVVARGIGFDDPSDAESLLPRVAATTAPMHLRTFYTSASEADLGAARDEVRAVLEHLDALDALVSIAVGPLFDRSLLVRVREQEIAVGLLLVWLPLRLIPRVRKGYELFLATLRALARGANPGEALSALDAQLKLIGAEGHSNG